MAILNGIEATVQVNGHDLEEYDDEEDEGNETNTQSKYVEASSGASFAILTKIGQSAKSTAGNAFIFHIYIDGVKVEVFTMGYHNTFRVTQASYECNHGVASIRPFSFKQMDITDDRPVLRDRSLLDKLSTITVKAWRMLINYDVLFGNGSLVDGVEKLDQMGPIAEKAIKGKGLSLSAKLGAKILTDTRRVYSMKYIDRQDSPTATFRLKYRSRQTLQSMLLVARDPSPRTATPVPLELRPVNELTVNELRQLVTEQRARSEVKHEDQTKHELVSEAGQWARLKRERDDEYEDLVASAVVKKAKTCPIKNEEVVDLYE